MHFLLENKEYTMSQPLKTVCKQDLEFRGKMFRAGQVISLRIVNNVASLVLEPGGFEFNLKSLTTEERDFLLNLTHYEENKEIVNSIIVDEVYVDDVILFINNFNRLYRSETNDLWLDAINLRDGSYELIFNSTMKTGCELIRELKKHKWHEDAIYEYDIDAADLPMYR